MALRGRERYSGRLVRRADGGTGIETHAAETAEAIIGFLAK
jgi:hypothetical protein